MAASLNAFGVAVAALGTGVGLDTGGSTGGLRRHNAIVVAVGAAVDDVAQHQRFVGIDL